MVTNPERMVDRKKWWSMHNKSEYICPDCGKRQEEHNKRWEVHHIDKMAGKCVSLCQTCHKVRHGATRSKIDLEVWKEEFLAIGD